MTKRHFHLSKSILLTPPRKEKPLKKLNSFDSPQKSDKKFYCSCTLNGEFKFACQNGYSWIQNCFTHYDYDKNVDAYNALVTVSADREIVSEDTEGQINKDLLRTFQKIELFASQNIKDKLMRILKALVAYDRDNGYTQGMNFIAAALIVHCEESVTFWLCTGLLEKYEIREVYSDDFSGMYKHIKIFSYLLKKHLPKVQKQFED